MSCSFTMRSPIEVDNNNLMRLLILTLLLFVNSPAICGNAQPDSSKLWLRSHAAIIMDQHSGEVLYQKNAEEILPIASITKLMTSMVILDAGLDMNASITITSADKDTLRYSRSRLPVGSRLKRFDLLKMALMASENRAAAALALPAHGVATRRDSGRDSRQPRRARSGQVRLTAQPDSFSSPSGWRSAPESVCPATRGIQRHLPTPYATARRASDQRCRSRSPL